MRSFASDNNAGVHPLVMAAMAEANQDHAIGYGDDPWTSRAVACLRKQFGADCEVFLVFTGTGANVLGLQAVVRSYHAVLCTQCSHLHVDECGAPEAHLGCKVLTVASQDGKLRVTQLEPFLEALGNEHHVQPRVVSITQATELGTVYRPAEIEALADFAHRHAMILHMDGARICNAAAALGLPLAALTADVGVDILSFGGTKNGMMVGEAVVFLQPRLAQDFKFIRKQGMQLGSKMRFIAAQFEALLGGELWQRNAAHANAMAKRLAVGVESVPGVRLVVPVEANGVFAEIPRAAIAPLQEKAFFYVWNEADSVVRWMTSFDTTAEDVDAFVEAVREVMSAVGTGG